MSACACVGGPNCCRNLQRAYQPIWTPPNLEPQVHMPPGSFERFRKRLEAAPVLTEDPTIPDPDPFF